MDPAIAHDPVFLQLLTQHEKASRQLRDAVAAMRSFHLNHHKSPQEENTSEKWRGSILGEEAAALFQRVEESAAQLLRYAYEIAPINNDPEHMEEMAQLKRAHRARLKAGVDWSGHRKTIRGIEEKVRIDDGMPVTVIIKPSAYEFTQRARAKQPAIDHHKPDSSADELKQVTDDDDAELPSAAGLT